MEDVNGKEIELQYVTVKVPGQRPRGSRSILSLQQQQQQQHSVASPILEREETETTPTATAAAAAAATATATPIGTPNSKKRDRSHLAEQQPPPSGGDSFEFQIVSLDNKRWFFSASSAEEREGWVAAIERHILASLKGEDGKKNSKADSIRLIREEVEGNGTCADCSAKSKRIVREKHGGKVFRCYLGISTYVVLSYRKTAKGNLKKRRGSRVESLTVRDSAPFLYLEESAIEEPGRNRSR